MRGRTTEEGGKVAREEKGAEEHVEEEGDKGGWKTRQGVCPDHRCVSTKGMWVITGDRYVMCFSGMCSSSSRFQGNGFFSPLIKEILFLYENNRIRIKQKDWYCKVLPGTVTDTLVIQTLKAAAAFCAPPSPCTALAGAEGLGHWGGEARLTEARRSLAPIKSFRFSRLVTSRGCGCSSRSTVWAWRCRLQSSKSGVPPGGCPE